MTYHNDAASSADRASRGKILLLDTAPDVRDLLAGQSYDVEWIERPARMHKRIKQHGFDVALLDIDSGSDHPELGLCRSMTAAWPDTPVVVMTRSQELETVVGAMRSGAYDFIARPVAGDTLHRTVERALHHRAVRCHGLVAATGTADEIEGVIGSSAGMRSLCAVIDQVAQADTSVLVMGESGTGKELVARAIHRRSRRHDRPFVAVNCGAIPPALLESELFGHVKGAFTSATANNAGLFAHAQGGTLLLDEIGEMPLEMQAKLLRVLQERTVRPVGGESEVPFDVRVIGTTNRDLSAEVAARRFRQDLYYRLNVVQIDVPALRARGDDVLRLAEHFVAKAAARLERPAPAISRACARKLLSYRWPGNVRELENTIERAVALSKSDTLEVRDLPRPIALFVSATPRYDDSQPLTLPSLAEVERSYIQRVLESVQGNKSRAARVLGLDRRTLYRRLEKFQRATRAHVRGAEASGGGDL